MRSYLYSFGPLVLWLLSAGCTHSTSSPSEPSAAPVSFSYHILPIIESSCGVTTCHDVQTHQAGLILSSYAAIRSLVEKDDTAHSALYQRICSLDTSVRMPKPPELALTELQRTLIKNWILQGADNIGDPTDVADTSHISYKNTIAPIFEIHCRGCHNAFDHAGHFDATNIEHLRAYASDGTLIGVITHSDGYQPMPRNADTLGPMLLAADIACIKGWITQGTPNN